MSRKPVKNKPREPVKLNPDKPADQASDPVAVIDIGSNSIRMVIAQFGADGRIRTLEAMEQAVNIGHGTFTRGHITIPVIETCVKILKSFAIRLDEYQVGNRNIRAVATSAVREARNRLKVLDRLYIATGIEVEVIDEAETSRLNYLSVYDQFKTGKLVKGHTAILEIGGGSTELVWLKKGKIFLHQTYRLGALRMREMLDTEYISSPRRFAEVMSTQIERTNEQMVEAVGKPDSVQVLIHGGDARFLARQLIPDWDPETLGQISYKDLAKFTRKILHMTEDELVREIHMSFADAATLGPALLAYVRFAKTFGLKTLYVSGRTLRDGLLVDMSGEGAWVRQYRNQCLRAAEDLGDKYNANKRHAGHVADLCDILFDVLEPRHHLSGRHRMLLRMAALLHEVGLYISLPSHHKHSMYIIMNSELFGLGENDRLLVALMARYHRRATPSPAHPYFSSLRRDRRIIVTKAAAILRVADALDRGHSQRIKSIDCQIEDDQFIIYTDKVDDLTLEQLALNTKGDLFQEVFGLKVKLRKARKSAGSNLS